MAIEVIKENFQSNTLKAREEVQSLIETQIYLSPAKPDIEKLIWIKNKVDILDTRIIKDKLIITGKMKYDLLYKSPDEERNLHTLDTDVEFTEEILVEGIDENMESYIDTKIEHTEWELFENKVDLRSVVNIKVDVREIREFELANEIKGEEGLQTLEEHINYRAFFAQQVSYANLQDKISVDESLPEIDNILNFHIKVNEQETIITEDRIISSAEVRVNIIYSGEDQIHSIEEELSLNHFLEIEGVNNSFIPKIKFEDIQGNYEIRENELGESKIIDLDIKVKVIGEAYYESLQNLITDVYSITDTLNIEGEEIELSENLKTLDYENEVVVDIGEVDALEILDIEYNINNIQSYIDGDLIIDSLLILDIIYINKMTGELTKHNYDFPFRTTIDNNLEDNLDIRLQSQVKDIGYTIKKDGLEVFAKISYDIELLKARRVYGITNLEKGPEALDQKERPSITVYIVQKGDTLWDIAKRYRTTVNMIESLSENQEELKPGDKIIIEKEVPDIDI